MNRIIIVNMKDLTVDESPIPERLQKWGGRGLTSLLISEMVPPKCDALGKENVLVVAPGLLSGTPAPCSGRISFGSKSPLTGTIKESNAGGMAAKSLAKLRVKAIIIREVPSNDCLYLLHIGRDRLALLEAKELGGLGNYDTVSKIKKRFQHPVSIISIGQAGEQRFLNSTIAVTDQEGIPCRHAARGGLGAVMGSKRLKAIVIDDVRGVSPLPIQDRKTFTCSNTSLVAQIRKTPLTGKFFPTYGTAGAVDLINNLGGLPTCNFRYGSFDRASKINGESLRDTILKRGGKTNHGCQPGCPIRCSNVYIGPDGNYLTASLEYETIGLLGSNCGIDDLDAIATLDRLCDDYGLDTIETGAALGIAMEQNVLPFGDYQGAIQILSGMFSGNPIAQMIGRGALRIGEALKCTRVPVVKGQAISAYDPRAIKGTGVTYLTSPMGADHTAGNVFPGTSPVPPEESKGQVAVSRARQIRTAAWDCTGLCLFASRVYGDEDPAKELVGMLNARYGAIFQDNFIWKFGIDAMKIEKDFNRQAGHSDVERLPDFMREEALMPWGKRFDVDELELQNFYSSVDEVNYPAAELRGIKNQKTNCSWR